MEVILGLSSHVIYPWSFFCIKMLVWGINSWQGWVVTYVEQLWEEGVGRLSKVAVNWSPGWGLGIHMTWLEHLLVSTVSRTDVVLTPFYKTKAGLLALRRQGTSILKDQVCTVRVNSRFLAWLTTRLWLNSPPGLALECEVALHGWGPKGKMPWTPPALQLVLTFILFFL